MLYQKSTENAFKVKKGRVIFKQDGEYLWVGRNMQIVLKSLRRIF